MNSDSPIADPMKLVEIAQKLKPPTIAVTTPSPDCINAARV
jgi:hypothetical protein